MRPASVHYGLLQRIDGHPVADVVQDVVEHLAGLLNVKAEYGSFVEGLGLSISDLMWSARPMVTLARHIKEQILQFEPRLRNPRIEPEPLDSHFCPAFRVYGQVGTSSVQLYLSLHTVYCTVHITQE